MNWLWPQIQDKEDAKKAAHGAAGMAFFVAIVTSIIAFLEMTGRLKLFGLGPEAFIDAGLFFGIGVGLLFHSRIAAVVGLILYVVEQVFMLKSGAGKPSIAMILFTLAFINGVRGSFAYHRMKKEESAPPPSEASPTPADAAPATETSQAASGGKSKKILVFGVLGILLIGGAAVALVAPQFLGGRIPELFNHQKTAGNKKAHGSLKIPFLSKLKLPKLPGSQNKVQGEDQGNDANFGKISDGETRTFKLKSGQTVQGKVILEDEVYYTVKTLTGEKIIIKEDLAPDEKS
jgi:hypothetical protein